MVTNYPQEIVTRRVGMTSPALDSGGAFSRLWRRVQFALCSLHGHDPLLHFDQNRMYLRCASCGHETPGWELDERRPRVRFQGDAKRHYAGPRLVTTSQRKIA